VRSSLALLAALAFAGCINTDTAIFVAPTLDMPAAAVMSNVFGGSVTGSFHLDLHLGARAGGPSTVTLGEFAILDAGKTSLVPALNVTSSTTFPAVVMPDSDVNADFTFDTGTKTLPMDVMTKLCDPAGIILEGTFDDSLAGKSTSVSSEVFHPSGCM
jgi:hypothetical protein